MTHRIVPTLFIMLAVCALTGCKRENAQPQTSVPEEMSPTTLLLVREEVGRAKAEAERLRQDLERYRAELNGAPGLDAEIARALQGKWKSERWSHSYLDFRGPSTVLSDWVGENKGIGQYQLRNGTLTITRGSKRDVYKVEIVSASNVILDATERSGDIFYFGDLAGGWKRNGPPAGTAPAEGCLKISCNGPVRVQRGHSIVVEFTVSGHRPEEPVEIRLHDLHEAHTEHRKLKWQTTEAATWQWQDKQSSSTWAEHRLHAPVSLFHARLSAGSLLTGSQYELIIEHPKSGATWKVPVEVFGK